MTTSRVTVQGALFIAKIQWSRQYCPSFIRILAYQQVLAKNKTCAQFNLSNIWIYASIIAHMLLNFIPTFVGRAYLNVCIAYTSRDEMATSIREVACGLAEGKLESR